MFCLYNDTPQWAIEKYGAFFCQLKPGDAVARRISECELPADVVCVQARNSHGAMDFANVASLENLMAYMRRFGREQKFFISCMEKEVSARLHVEFGGQIIELPGKNSRSMIDAVADMYLLSRGKEIVCTKGSTFAEVAWWLSVCNGLCPAKVTALSADYKQNGIVIV